MAENIDEQLSSLVDGECPAAEADLAVRRLCKQPQLTARWQRYHLISDAINGQLPAVLPADFADRVSRAVAAEPAPVASAVRADAVAAPRRYWIPAAAAASLVLALGVYTQTASPPAVVDAGDPSPAPAVDGADASMIAADSADPAAVDAARRAALESRLSPYLSSHTEYASVNGVYGILPYVHQQTAYREPR